MKILSIIQPTSSLSMNGKLSVLGKQKLTNLKCSDLKPCYNTNLFSYLLHNVRDITYKKQLLKNISLGNESPLKILPVAGFTEIKGLLAKLSTHSENYTVGHEQQNIQNGIYRANLHIHTINSDGFFTTQELLDKAANYGDYLAKTNKQNAPFVIAITDHDTTEGITEATKIISDNPEKYKNIRVIMGTEVTVFDNIATDMVNYPTNAHILVYGINPEEEKFKAFINNTKKEKLDTAQKMLDCANDVYKKVYNSDSIFSIDEAKKFSNQLQKGITGMFNQVRTYVKTKFILNEIVSRNKEAKSEFGETISSSELMQDMSDYYKPINRNNYKKSPQELIQEYLESKTSIKSDRLSKIIDNATQNDKANEFINNLDTEFEHYKITLNPEHRYAPTFETLNEALSNQKNVLVGIAHPLDYVKNMYDKDSAFIFLDKMYRKFKETFQEKALFCETYYQSYSKSAKELNEQVETIPLMKRLAVKYHLYNTGSLDNHRHNLFSRY